MPRKKELELTVLIPCLNEEETIKTVIDKAFKCIKENKLKAEVLIADNGSTDRSIEIAKECGARVVSIEEKGYGSALRGGTMQALGKYCIMGDADDSYDFLSLMPYVEKLREGYDMVMGNRFTGGIAEGAMPALHKYLGTPVLSFLGRLLYKNKIGDYNCGMRGYNTERIKALNLKSTGMEYASEMIIMCCLNNYSIAEIPTTLAKDGRTKNPYLHTWQDGWRHLKFMLVHCPDWTFYYPGLIVIGFGLIMLLASLINPQQAITNYAVAMIAFAAGLLGVLSSIVVKTIAYKTKFIPTTQSIEKVWNINVDNMIIRGLILLLVSLLLGLIISNSFIKLTFYCLTAIGLELFFTGFIIETIKRDI